MVRFVNLTPHEINLILENKKMTIKPSGTIARVSMTYEETDKIDCIPVYVPTYGDVENVPEPKDDTIYIVSNIVAQALKERTRKYNDIIVPDTSPEGCVQENGKIVGVKRFLKII